MASGLLCETLPDIVLRGISIVVFSSVIAFINWHLAAIYLGTIVVIVAVQTLISKPIQSKTQVTQQKRAEANAFAQEIIAQRTTIKAYSAHSTVLGWYGQLVQPWLKANMSAQLVSVPLRTLGWVFGMAPTFVICIAGAVMVQNNSLTFAAFMTIYFLSEQMTNDCMHYIDLFIQYRKGSAAAQRLWDIIDAPREVAEGTGACAENANAPVIEFQNVSFSYGAQPTIADISFAVRQGEKVAIVGGSGSGKSTVLRVAEGFISPQSGRVLCGGKPYSEIGFAKAREKISFVPQFTFMFAETLKNNVALLRENEISDEETCKIYENAGVDTFLEKLPLGENTVVGDGGTKLSTGQGQRVAIARGLAKRAKLLILDEATSALDAQSDKKIFDTIARLPKDISALVVTHRLSHLQAFDTIYVMDAGHIAEFGSPSELMAANGVYARLCNVQEEATI